MYCKKVYLSIDWADKRLDRERRAVWWWKLSSEITFSRSLFYAIVKEAQEMTLEQIPKEWIDALPLKRYDQCFGACICGSKYLA